MKNLLIVSALVLVLVSCGAENKTVETVENNDIEMANDVEMVLEESGSEEVNMEKPVVEEVMEQEVDNAMYGDLTIFINTELSDKQKNKLSEILEQRSARQVEIAAMLEKAVNEWTLEEVLEQVKSIRSTCASRILPYVASDKIEDFTSYCEAGNDKLKEKFSN